jgi:uncharacterized protein (DUF983 family)
MQQTGEVLIARPACRVTPGGVFAMEWQPASRRPVAELWPQPKFGQAILRGLRGRCPICGVGAIFRGYLRVQSECSNCHAPLGRVRADDAPPYFTIFAVGHLVVPSMLWVERAYMPSLWWMAAIFLPLTALLSLALIRPIKGATVGLLMRLGLSDRDHQPAPIDPRHDA